MNRDKSATLVVSDLHNKERMLPADGRVRVAIEGVSSRLDCLALPAKRIVGDFVLVEPDISTDNHDSIAGEGAGRL